MRLQPLSMLGHIGHMAYGDPPPGTDLLDDVVSFNKRFRISLIGMGRDIPDSDPIEVSPGDGAMADAVEAQNSRYRDALYMSDIFVEIPDRPSSFGIRMLADALEINNQRYIEALATTAPQE